MNMHTYEIVRCNAAGDIVERVTYPRIREQIPTKAPEAGMQKSPMDYFRDRMKEALDLAAQDGVPWSLIQKELLNRLEENRPDSDRKFSN
ncbi:MAG: hypothetical protein AAF982_08745 [Pseudomonadota bacterium]